MNWQGIKPELQYPEMLINGMRVLLSKGDDIGYTFNAALEFLDRHGFAAWLTYYHAVYYLRGHKSKAEFEDVLVGMQETSTLPPELYEIIHCLQFWNQEGRKCYEMNKDQGEEYRDFIIRCIAADCRVFVEPHWEKFLTGRGSNHVWVTDRLSNQRVLLIHF